MTRTPFTQKRSSSSQDTGVAAIMRFISLRRAASAATVILLTSAAHAQGVFKVQVTPTIVGRSGDILTMSYGVRVLRGSTDSLSMFLVDGPGTRLKVVEPSPSESWATRSAFQGHPGAAWMLLEELTRAGQ